MRDLIIRNLYVYLSLPRYDKSHFDKLRGYISCLYDLGHIDLDDKVKLNQIIDNYSIHKSGYLNADTVDSYITELKYKYIY